MPFRKLPILITVGILYGCATGNPYNRLSWVNQNNEADWDLDVAICLEHSEELTQEEWKEVQQIEKEAQELQGYSGELDTTGMEESAQIIGETVIGIMNFISSYKEMSAEQVVKEKKFTTCIQERGWGHN